MLDDRQFPTEGSTEEQIEALLSFAVRAPSTHNTQPWLFQITGNICELYADYSRKLPEGDKDGRCLFISLGACLEHLERVAEYFMMLDRVEIGRLDVKTASPIARLFLHNSQGKNDDLLPTIKAIKCRFNARGPFLPTPISAELKSAIASLYEGSARLHFLTKKNDLAQCAALTSRGMRAVHRKRAFRVELSNWMISNYSNRKDGIPGYTMLAPGILSFVLPWIIRTFNLGGFLAALNTKSFLSAAGAGVITSSEDTPRAWLDTGRLFERASLLVVAAGAKTSVYVAAIETPELRKELQAHLKTPEFPQFLFSVGYPKIMLRQSPRHSPRERMI